MVQRPLSPIVVEVEAEAVEELDLHSHRQDQLLEERLEAVEVKGMQPELKPLHPQHETTVVDKGESEEQ